MQLGEAAGFANSGGVIVVFVLSYREQAGWWSGHGTLIVWNNGPGGPAARIEGQECCSRDWKLCWTWDDVNHCLQGRKSGRRRHAEYVHLPVVEEAPVLRRWTCDVLPGWEDVGCNGRPGKKQAWNPEGSDSEVEAAGDRGDKRGGGGRKVRGYFCRRRQACGGWMADSNRPPSSSHSRKEEDNWALMRKEWRLE